jgi:hypothetical protein
MTIFSSGLFITVFVMSILNWFYLQEVETAKIRIGLLLPKKMMVLFRGFVMVCFFASLSMVLTFFVSLF